MSQFLHRVRFRRDHRWVPGRMSAYLDGELAAGRRTRMQRHAGECAECRRLLTGLSQTLDALHRLNPLGGAADAVRIAASVRLRLGDPPAS
jgi:anti-sigma factor RsiW